MPAAQARKVLLLPRKAFERCPVLPLTTTRSASSTPLANPCIELVNMASSSLSVVVFSSCPTGTFAGLILEIDIWRVAYLMLKRYGDEADIESAIPAKELANAGDWAGEAIWQRIIDVIGDAGYAPLQKPMV